MPGAQLLDPTSQITGVSDPKLLPVMTGVYEHLGRDGLIVHSANGLDELSPTADNVLLEIRRGKVCERTLTPEDLGVRRCRVGQIREYTRLDEQVRVSRNILEGRDEGCRSDFVAVNAAALLYLAKATPTLRSGVAEAKELIRSGAVAETLHRFLTS